MATYAELFDLGSDATLLNRIAVAVAVKAQIYIDGATPSPDQLAWASRVIRSPLNEARTLVNYVLAANKAASTGAISGASDASIQTNVSAAVDALVAGGIT